MPRLSQLIAPETAFPSQTGQPRGTVDIPAVPLPAPPSSLGQAIPQAATALGGQVAETGQALLRDQQRFDLLAARVSQAEAKTQALHGKNQYDAAVETLAADLKLQGPASTYPTRLREGERQTRQRISQGLSPHARDLFEVEAGQTFGVLHRAAEHYRVTETLKGGILAVDEAQAQYIEGMVGNSNPEDMSQKTVGFLKTLQDFDSLGLLPPGDGAKRFRVAQETIDLQTWENRIASDPQGAYRQLRQGVQANEDVPVQAYDGLLKRAEDAVFTAFQREEALGRAAQTTATREQDDAYNNINVALTAATIDQVPDLLARASQLLVNRQIGKEHYDAFRNNAFSHQARLRSPTPAVIDDPHVEDGYRRRLAQPGKTGDAIAELQASLAREGRLSGKTVEAMQADLARQRDANYYINRRSYAEGNDYIEIAILPQINKSVARLVGTAPAKEDAAQTLALAKAAYRRRLDTAWKTSPPEVFDELAFSTAREVVDTFGQLQGLALRDLPETAVVPSEVQNALSPTFQALSQKYQEYYTTLAGRQDLSPPQKVREFDIIGQREFIERLLLLQAGKANAPAPRVTPAPSGAPPLPAFPPGGVAPRRP